MKNLHFENSVSYVRGQNQATETPLPLIPPIKIINELKYELSRKSSKGFQDPYIKIELINVVAQNRVDPFESTTRGYTLTNVGLGSNLLIGKQTAHIFIKVANIFNVSYYNHLSRLKEISVHGTGRNISIGVFVPIGLK